MNNPFKLFLNLFKSESAIPEKKHYADSVILDEYGNILLLQRSYQDDFHAGKWCLPGGKIEAGEETGSAAERELMEETGLMVSLTHLDIESKPECEINYFIGHLSDMQLICLDNDEHYRYQWIAPDELDNYELLLDLGDKLKSFNLDQLMIGAVGSEDIILKDLDHNKLSKAFDRGEISDEDYTTYSTIKHAMEQITKGFDEDLVTEDEYLGYLEKSKRYEFVKVVRDGKQFFQYRLVGTDKTEEKPVDDLEVGDFVEDTTAELKLTKYSDKSFLITGNTYGNIDLLREIKKELGYGEFNKKLGGWIFPSFNKDVVLSLLAKKMETGTYEETIAQEQIVMLKNAYEIGTKVTVDGVIGEIVEVTGDDQVVYAIELEVGKEIILANETSIGVAPATPEKAEELINIANEENRFQVTKQLEGKAEGETPEPEDVPTIPIIEVKEFTTRSGEKVDALDLTVVDPIDITLIPQDKILGSDRPYYIPAINEYRFTGASDSNFCFDYVKLEEGKFLVALNGYDKDLVKYFANDRYVDSEHKYAVMTLDNLVATNEYYRNKRKAELKAEADAKNERAIKNFKSLSEKDQLYYLYYDRLSDKQKKVVSEDQFNAMSLEEKHELMPDMKKKPYKTYGSSRISPMDDQHMLVSNFTMYKKFVDKDYEVPKFKYNSAVDRCAIEYKEVRDQLKWKAIDMRIQKEDNDSSYKKGKETSYGDIGTRDDLLETLGVKIKSQNGKDMLPNQIDDIKVNLAKIYESFGDRSSISQKFGLKVSHAGDTYMHASKFSGVYMPGMHAIGVGHTHDNFGFTFAHEFAHFIDNYLGKQTFVNGKAGMRYHYASDNFDSTPGKVASTFRKHMNESTDSDYMNRTCECFARALEQYHAMKHGGDDAVRFGKKKYVEDPNQVNKENFEKHVKPLIEQMFSENDHLLKSENIFHYVEEINIIEKADLSQGDPSHGGKLVKVNKTDKAGKKTTKWVNPDQVEKEVTSAKSGNHEVNIKHRDIADKDLVQFAKEASEADLQATISGSGDEKHRKVAQDELHRRATEEDTASIKSKEEKEAKNKEKEKSAKDKPKPKSDDKLVKKVEKLEDSISELTKLVKEIKTDKK